MCKVGQKCYKDPSAPPTKGGNTVITVDDGLIKYAERRAKEILGENMAYSPHQKQKEQKSNN